MAKYKTQADIEKAYPNGKVFKTPSGDKRTLTAYEIWLRQFNPSCPLVEVRGKAQEPKKEAPVPVPEKEEVKAEEPKKEESNGKDDQSTPQK